MARSRPPFQRTLHQTGHIKYAIQGTSANLSYVSWCCLSGVRCQHFGFIFLLEATSLSFSIHFLFQVMQQYQCSFEFNDKFLQTLFENAYSSNYGKDHVNIVRNTTLIRGSVRMIFYPSSVTTGCVWCQFSAFFEIFFSAIKARFWVIATMTGTSMVFVKIQLVYGKTNSLKL